MKKNIRSRTYGHKISIFDDEYYNISWNIDFFKYPNSKFKFTSGFSRITDIEGAKRFSKKWNVPIPDKPQKSLKSSDLSDHDIETKF